MSDTIYFVDEHDNATGKTSEKFTGHNQSTELHAAFSCYVFNDKGQFLVTQRAGSKKVWPLIWTNSCCGHPEPRESRLDAIKRRFQYELGATSEDPQLILEDYSYITPPYNNIVEHEYCPVYVAIINSKIIPNPDEVQDFAWVEWEWFVQELTKDSDDYSVYEFSAPSEDEINNPNTPKWSWWCKDQVQLLIKNEKFINFIKAIKE